MPNNWTAERAESVACRALRNQGLIDTNVQLIRFASNGLFKSDPADNLVVRVNPPGRPSTLGFHCAQLLCEKGFAVIGPSITNTPIEIDGCQVSFWPLYRETSGDVDFVELGALIERIHESSEWLGRSLGFESRDSERLRREQLIKIRARIAKLRLTREFDQDDLDLLSSKYSEIARSWSETEWGDLVVLHADVHPGNVLVTARGQYLLDFDHVCTGPSAWDHIPLLSQVKFFGTSESAYVEFARGYGRDVRCDAAIDVLVEARSLASTTWIAQLSVIRPELRPEAELRMSYWRTGELSRSWSAS